MSIVKCTIVNEFLSSMQLKRGNKLFEFTTFDIFRSRSSATQISWIFKSSDNVKNSHHLISFELVPSDVRSSTSTNSTKDMSGLIEFYVGLMRRSNCSAPIPPGQPRGQRKNVCDKKGRGT